MHHIIEEIRRERERQIQSEGWTFNHDDAHTNGSLAMAAACYAAPEKIFIQDNEPHFKPYDAWPWDRLWDKRKKHDRKRQLIIAAALIVAEYERLERL